VDEVKGLVHEGLKLILRIVYHADGAVEDNRHVAVDFFQKIEKEVFFILKVIVHQAGRESRFACDIAYGEIVVALLPDHFIRGPRQLGSAQVHDVVQPALVLHGLAAFSLLRVSRFHV